MCAAVFYEIMVWVQLCISSTLLCVGVEGQDGVGCVVEDLEDKQCVKIASE